MEQLQSHIYDYRPPHIYGEKFTHFLIYIRKPCLIYMTLQLLLHYEFPYTI
jgi:hypothetical protein